VATLKAGNTSLELQRSTQLRCEDGTKVDLVRGHLQAVTAPQEPLTVVLPKDVTVTVQGGSEATVDLTSHPGSVVCASGSVATQVGADVRTLGPGESLLLAEDKK
jgi:ferric-dicitrate binding protein FerR (iron transport regulator)